MKENIPKSWKALIIFLSAYHANHWLLLERIQSLESIIEGKKRKKNKGKKIIKEKKKKKKMKENKGEKSHQKKRLRSKVIKPSFDEG